MLVDDYQSTVKDYDDNESQANLVKNRQENFDPNVTTSKTAVDTGLQTLELRPKGSHVVAGSNVQIKGNKDRNLKHRMTDS